MPKPIAFMVMPFNRKPTGITDGSGPTEVDFDRLWFDVYHPVLEELGYHAVRADSDVGSLIITEMIQRLVVGQLIVADLTLANANVYYEVGVRHAASEFGCVLTAADWGRPVFDTQQLRRVEFPLADGDVGPDAALVAKARLAAALPPLIRGCSPVYAAVPGYPGAVDDRHLTALTDLADDLAAFDADIGAVRIAPQAERPERARALLERHGHKPAVREADVLQLLRLLGEVGCWEELLGYVAGLPRHLANHPLVVEKRCLAAGKLRSPVTAAAELAELIARHGPTPERLGLLGGRYKDLRRKADNDRDRSHYLDLAIDSYAEGMLLDLNAYYPANNLPALYRRRGRPGDEERAVEAESVVAAACRRAGIGPVEDPWILPTLLGMAFRARDFPRARELADAIGRAGAADWLIETTMKDLREGGADELDLAVRAELEQVVAELELLMKGGTP